MTMNDVMRHLPTVHFPTTCNEVGGEMDNRPAEAGSMAGDRDLELSWWTGKKQVCEEHGRELGIWS